MATAATTAKEPYLTAPVPSDKMPKGIPYIVGNEAAERFSYYGMKAILVVFMTKYLMDSGGAYDVMSEEEAKSWFHFFGAAVYFFPILGAILADAFFGKYKTILWISLVYCAGHGVLAVWETREGLAVGLTLIAVGSGGIKPCVSAHVGDQFGQSNAHLIEKVFGWFYFAINFGSTISTLLTPILLAEVGPAMAFGIPGLLMFAATIVFWMGRKVFVHIPPQGMDFVKEVFSGTGLRAMGRLAVIYLFVAMFWALFDQTGSSWVLQADKMDREWLGIVWLPSQIQAINPILVMAFIPLFGFVIYPAINKVFPLTPLRKIAIGFFITVPAFILPAYVQEQIEAGVQVSIAWQLASYIIITAAEVMVSITALEFSYTQAPKKMKSFIMGLYLMSVFAGNMFTAGVNVFMQEQTPVADKLPTSGSYVAKVEKHTRFALTCEAPGKEAASERKLVELVVPIDKGDKDEKKDVVIKTFGAKRALTAERVMTAPGEEVELIWEVEGATECNLRPPGGIVETKGKKTVAPDKKTTFALACKNGEDGDEEEKKITIVAGDGPAIASFEVDKKTVAPPGGEVTLKWKAARSEGCKIVAHTNSLSGPGYYMFFAYAMLITAILFVFVAIWYKPQTFIQDEASVEAQVAAQSGGDDPSEGDA